MKEIKQRQQYIKRKSIQLDTITDFYKYTHRLSRIMLYHRLLTEIEISEIKRILK